MTKLLVAIILGQWRKQLRVNLLLSKKKLNVLLYSGKWIEWILNMQLINGLWKSIFPEEYKSQHIRIKSHTSTKKSKVEYIHEWILKSQEEHTL
jgi:hypothetical protein